MVEYQLVPIGQYLKPTLHQHCDKVQFQIIEEKVDSNKTAWEHFHQGTFNHIHRQEALQHKHWVNQQQKCITKSTFEVETMGTLN